eukprot:7251705-Alexandrium_andersonii.AAC.1
MCAHAHTAHTHCTSEELWRRCMVTHAVDRLAGAKQLKISSSHVPASAGKQSRKDSMANGYWCVGVLSLSILCGKVCDPPAGRPNCQTDSPEAPATGSVSPMGPTPSPK